METRKIGSLEVSLAGLGCNNFGWRIGEEPSAAVVNAALSAGINFFDTADMYGDGRSEEFLGRALGPRRNSILIATKFGLTVSGRPAGGHPSYVRSACEDSLGRLATDRIDLYQLHRPDPAVPIAETLGALRDLIQEGKVREIGCSNFSAEQLREAETAGQGPGARFASVQNEYSLIKREAEAEVLPECARSGLAFLPYFPLASGLLTGKYRSGQPLPEGSRGGDAWGPRVFTDQNLALVEALVRYAMSRGRTILELAMSWLAARPEVASVIAGATSPRQVEANAAALAWKLTDTELADIEAILSEPR
jgi:aryl-alcohol dehydrogenase-like predicted oxidoreductase